MRCRESDVYEVGLQANEIWETHSADTKDIQVAIAFVPTAHHIDCTTYLHVPYLTVL